MAIQDDGNGLASAIPAECFVGRQQGINLQTEVIARSADGSDEALACRLRLSDSLSVNLSPDIIQGILLFVHGNVSFPT